VRPAGSDDVTGIRISSSQGIAGWVVQSGPPIAVSDVVSDPRFSREQAERTGYVPQTILAVPVETPERMQDSSENDDDTEGHWRR
jgi:hypothetical protein